MADRDHLTEQQRAMAVQLLPDPRRQLRTVRPPRRRPRWLGGRPL